MLWIALRRLGRVKFTKPFNQTTQNAVIRPQNPVPEGGPSPRLPRQLYQNVFNANLSVISLCFKESAITHMRNCIRTHRRFCTGIRQFQSCHLLAELSQAAIKPCPPTTMNVKCATTDSDFFAEPLRCQYQARLDTLQTTDARRFLFTKKTAKHNCL